MIHLDRKPLRKAHSRLYNMETPKLDLSLRSAGGFISFSHEMSVGLRAASHIPRCVDKSYLNRSRRLQSGMRLSNGRLKRSNIPVLRGNLAV
jgi:hypothetical protein